MVVGKQNYEELRKQRVEENKKRMEELNLPQLIQSLKSPKPSLMKRTKPRAIGTEMVEVRRSSRVKGLPANIYKDIVVYVSKSGRRYRVKCEAGEYAINKAEELESKLEDGHPSFVKTMLQSHVTGGSLSFAGYFCRNDLPKSDGIVTLIDEDGEAFPVVYLAHNAGFSGGWRGFSISHELSHGDALVFRLIEPTVFKVYIIRKKDYYAENENNDGSDT